MLVNDFSSVTNRKFIESPTFLNSFLGALGGNGLDIKQVPYAPQEGKTKDGIPFATGIYINYMETERAVFLPQFNEKLKDMDDEALDQFEKLFSPQGKTVVPVKCNDLAKEGGVLNCISWN